MRSFFGLEVPKGPQGSAFQVQGCDRLNISNVALGAEVRHLLSLGSPGRRPILCIRSMCRSTRFGTRS